MYLITRKRVVNTFQTQAEKKVPISTTNILLPLIREGPYSQKKNSFLNLI